jgi:hypothetical protein
MPSSVRRDLGAIHQLHLTQTGYTGATDSLRLADIHRAVDVPQMDRCIRRHVIHLDTAITADRDLSLSPARTAYIRER